MLNEEVGEESRFMSYFEKNAAAIAEDISSTMGKPLSQAQGEVKTTLVRAKALVAQSGASLAPIKVAPGREIHKEPIGPVLCLTPWNYPLLCTVNALAAAVLAGCSVLIKVCLCVWVWCGIGKMRELKHNSRRIERPTRRFILKGRLKRLERRKDWCRA